MRNIWWWLISDDKFFFPQNWNLRQALLRSREWRQRAEAERRRGGDLYLEVCVIDAFKDERWSSGLCRETESQSQDRKKTMIINSSNMTARYYFSQLIDHRFNNFHCVIFAGNRVWRKENTCAQSLLLHLNQHKPTSPKNWWLLLWLLQFAGSFMPNKKILQISEKTSW